jgi:glycine/D-amino acid oxidase-like deaminating enzyme
MTTPRFMTATDSPFPATADVVIIGGGPAGCAAAWAIERAAPGTRIVVLEQSNQLAAGSSLASLENFRTCWAAPCLHRMMQRSIEVFHHADTYFGEGTHLGLKQQGYLFVAFTAQQAEQLRTDVEHLHRYGLTHVAYLDAAAVQAAYGWLGNKVIAAKYDPIAGWLDSNALVYAFANATQSTTFVLDVRDVSILMDGDRVSGVRTASGNIAAPNVVIAAGANARAIGRTVGIELPIVVRPRQSFTTGWRHDGFREDAPCVISAAPFPHVRPEAQSGAIFGYEYQWNTRQLADTLGEQRRSDALIDPLWPVEQMKDPRFPSLTLHLLAQQFGHAPGTGFADPRYLRGIYHRAGYYVYRDNAYTTLADGSYYRYDSQRAIIDQYPGIDGLFLSIAHVGHGIMSAPAAGEILASKLLGQPLPHPTFADFGLHVPYVEHDLGGLSANHLPANIS